MKPLRPNPKPGVYGYLAGWAHTVALEEKRSRLSTFAEREGYELIEIYEEDVEGGPSLQAVIEATRITEAPALLMYALGDLGSTARAQRTVKRRLKTEVGVPVILVEPGTLEVSAPVEDGAPVREAEVVVSRETFSVHGLTLSRAQAGLLLFFADPYSAHCTNTNPKILRALVSRGLLERDGQTNVMASRI